MSFLENSSPPQIWTDLIYFACFTVIYALFGGEGSHMITCSIFIEWLPVGKGIRRIRPDSPLLETTGIRLLTMVKTNNMSIVSES